MNGKKGSVGETLHVHFFPNTFGPLGVEKMFKEKIK
jgi:hypothetical protein